MLQFLKLSISKSFSSRKNGGTTFEEADEKSSSRKGVEVEKEKDVRQETLWDAKYLEAKAIVKFKKVTFIKDLVYHTLYPVSIPLMMWLDGGMYALKNRFFWPAKGVPSALVFFQLAMGFCFYAFNGVSLFLVIRGKKFDFLYDIALVDTIWILRNAVVATKYAFESEVDMHRMRTELLGLRQRLQQTVSMVQHLFEALVTLGFRAGVRFSRQVWELECQLVDMISVVDIIDMVLGGWADPLPRRVLKQELLLAAVRCRKYLTKYSFQVDTSVDSYEAMRDLVLDLHLGKDIQERKQNLDVLDESNKWLMMGRDECLDMMAKTKSGSSFRPSSLPVRLYAAHVIRQSSSLSRLRRVGHTLLSQYLRQFAFFVSIIITSVPFILRLLLGGHGFSGPKWSIWVVACSAFVIMYFSMYSNIAFMMVGILDLRRRHYVATKLDELLRTGVYTGNVHVRDLTSPRSLRSRSLGWLRSRNSLSSSPGASSSGSERSSLTGHGIVIDFHNVQSLQAWWITRVLVHDFGLGFFKRIKYYTTYFACYCGILVILIGLRLLKGIKREDIYILIGVVVCLDAFLTLLALMIWPGGDINSMRQVQGATLTHSKLKLQMKINQEKDDLSAEELKEYHTVIHTMSSISEAVRWDNDKHEISVCGFQAGEQLLSVIVATLTASVAIGAGQIVANVVNTDAN